MEILALVILVGCVVTLKVIFGRVRRRGIDGEIEGRLARYGGRRI
jgi:hypothetical protein